eukprot:scaffold3079_cov187-Ochromonas_danica.AAC.8
MDKEEKETEFAEQYIKLKDANMRPRDAFEIMQKLGYSKSRETMYRHVASVLSTGHALSVVKKDWNHAALNDEQMSEVDAWVLNQNTENSPIHYSDVQKFIDDNFNIQVCTRTAGNILHRLRDSQNKCQSKTSELDNTTSTTTATINHETSEYEKIRLDNIKRNEEYLASLGLTSSIPKTRSSSTTTARSSSSSSSLNKAKRKRSLDSIEFNDDDENDEVGRHRISELQPTRRSRRISSLKSSSSSNNDNNIKEEEEPFYFLEDNKNASSSSKRGSSNLEGLYFTDSIDWTDEDLHGDQRKIITAPQLRALIQSMNPEHDELISNTAVTHCAYRMSYMSNKQLVTRLQAVARAATKKSYEKLLTFYYALMASGLEKLSQVALERLQTIGVITSSPLAQNVDQISGLAGENRRTTPLMHKIASCNILALFSTYSHINKYFCTKLLGRERVFFTKSSSKYHITPQNRKRVGKPSKN